MLQQRSAQHPGWPLVGVKELLVMDSVYVSPVGLKQSSDSWESLSVSVRHQSWMLLGRVGWSVSSAQGDAWGLSYQQVDGAPVAPENA